MAESASLLGGVAGGALGELVGAFLGDFLSGVAAYMRTEIAIGLGFIWNWTAEAFD